MPRSHGSTGSSTSWRSKSMKLIKKGKEPPGLREYRSDPFATYEGYSGKDELREALAREQGFLCCYCMSRISANERDMKIEHRVAQRNAKGVTRSHPPSRRHRPAGWLCLEPHAPALRERTTHLRRSEAPRAPSAPSRDACVLGA